MTKFLIAAKKGRHQARNRALALTLYDVGLRAMEIGLLERSAFDFSDRSLLVFGKKGKVRKLFLRKKTVRVIKRHFDGCVTGAAFLTEKRKRFNRHSLKCLLRRICDRAGIRRFGSHLFRHTFAVNLWNKEKKIEVVQVALGHSDLETTFEYLKGLKCDLSDLETVMKRSSAADDLPQDW